MKILILILILVILSLALFLISGFINKINKPNVIVNNVVFKTEIAKTQAQKERGLAKYNNIDNNFTMIFPFEKIGIYTFWMKDMRFSIDIIYIRNNKIVQIFKNVPSPHSSRENLPLYKPSVASDTVMEINAGLSNKYNFKNGDKVTINY